MEKKVLLEWQLDIEDLVKKSYVEQHGDSNEDLQSLVDVAQLRLLDYLIDKCKKDYPFLRGTDISKRLYDMAEEMIK